MRRQSNWLARAASAAGLLALTTWLLPARAQVSEPADLRPGLSSQAQTVNLLDGVREGRLAVDARGNGDQSVRLGLRNTSGDRLQVVLPPGLVAAAATGQGGFQSMGLGAPTEQPGAFGAFRTSAGFRSVATSGSSEIELAPGATTDLTLPAVCLNFGLPTPTPKDGFRLVDVDDYTSEPRARKALRTLATLGTSQQVAQAVAWNVFNDVSFEEIAVRAGKKINPHELALASRFVEVLDMSGGMDMVDPAYLAQGRILVRLRGQGATAGDVSRLASDLESEGLFGLPVQMVEDRPPAEAGLASLFLDVVFGGTDRTLGRIQVQSRAVDRDAWLTLGTVGMKSDVAPASLDGAVLADLIDRTIAGSFVRTKVVRRSPERTTIAVENRLPLTITGLTIRTGESGLADVMDVSALGLSPARSVTTVVPAATGTIESVTFNGL